MNIKRILVLLLAISQPVAAYLSTLGDTSVLMDQARNPLITPATYAFGIWGVICLGAVVYGIYQITPAAKNKIYDEIAIPLSVVFAGFSAWLYFAQIEWILTTIVVFLIMGYSLWQAYSKIVAQYVVNKLTTFEKIFVYGTVSLYFGWASVAIFANIAAAVKFFGVNDTNLTGIIWQAGILVAATINALFWIKKSHGSWAYAATILWAFVAVVIGTVERGSIALPLTVVSLIASLAIAVYSLSFRKR